MRCVGCDVRCLGGCHSSDRISAFNHTLEELGREGKQASTANNSATVSSALGTRAKRAISKTTPGQKSDIEKPLKAVEER